MDGLNDVLLLLVGLEGVAAVFGAAAWMVYTCGWRLAATLEAAAISEAPSLELTRYTEVPAAGLATAAACTNDLPDSCCMIVYRCPCAVVTCWPCPTSEVPLTRRNCAMPPPLAPPPCGLVTEKGERKPLVPGTCRLSAVTYYLLLLVVVDSVSDSIRLREESVLGTRSRFCTLLIGPVLVVCSVNKIETR